MLTPRDGLCSVAGCVYRLAANKVAGGGCRSAGRHDAERARVQVLMRPRAWLWIADSSFTHLQDDRVIPRRKNVVTVRCCVKISSGRGDARCIVSTG